MRLDVDGQALTTSKEEPPIDDEIQPIETFVESDFLYIILVTIKLIIKLDVNKKKPHATPTNDSSCFETLNLIKYACCHSFIALASLDYG